MAREVAVSMLDDKVTELEEAQKQKPKEGKSVAEKIAARKEHKANIERIESEIERWQQIIQSGEERQACEKSRSEEADETPAVDTKPESGVDGEVKSEDRLQPIGKGVFGNIYDQFKGKVKEAFDFLTKHKSGDLLGVFHRDGFGDIDLVWGDNGGGLAHIIQRHVEEQNDFNSVEEVRDVMDDVIKNGSINERKSKWDKVVFEKDGYSVVVSRNLRDKDGNIIEQNKDWVVTVFDNSRGRNSKKRESSSDVTQVTPNTNKGGRAVAPNDNSSESKDTKSKAEGQEKSEESKETSLSEQISTASAEVNTDPTEAQKEAGNYKKGHVQVGTFDITIEQPQGSIRRGKDENGKKWESKMHNTYGYFRGTEGVDGDHIDVFLSNDIDGWNGHKVFVVDQYNPDGTFDEHKVMLGFNDVDEAKSDYLANYEKGWENGRRIDVTPVSLEDFEKWIGSSHRKTKAFAEYAGVKKEDLSASENGEGKEKVKPQEEQKPKNEKGEESKADGEKGKGEKIEDVGEKIEGARKDALKKLAESMEQATEEALVAMPFSKAFKRPNLKKAVEDGVLREEDALFAQAVMSAYLSRKKPLMSKSRSNYERERSEKTIKVWAHHAYNGVEKLKKLFSLSTSERDTFMMEEMNRPAYDPKDVEKRKQDLMEWNPGKVFNGTCYPINAIRLWNDVYTQLGYEVGTEVPQLFSEVLPTTGYDSYVLVAANGTKFYPARSLNSYNAVVDEIVYQTKVANADAYTDHPKETFEVKGSGEMKTKSSGKWYVVTQASLSAKPHKDIFSSKEEAEKFAEAYMKNDGKKVDKYRYASEPKEVKVFDGYGEYAVVLRRKNIGKGTTTDFELKYYNTEVEARVAIDAEHDELNELANKELAKDKGSKSASTKKPICSIEVYTKDGKSWKYGIVLSDKYAPKKSALNTMPYYLAKDFNTRKEAQAYLDAHKEEIEAKAAKVDEARRNFKYFTANGERVGTDYRHGEDVSADQFREQFGFRGVQFGNWTNQRDRQEAINQAFDAFMDLSRLLGVSPRALSLNGELGIAFGARGSGKALAHYEPKEVVINLTKTSGAGSLAHEWWHALDNYFARQGNVAMGMVTESKGISMRDELRQAFNTLIDHLYKSPYNQRSKQRGSSYWGTPIEETARMFEQWVNDQLAERGEKSPFLTDVDPYIEERYAQMNYEMHKFFMGDKAMPYEEYKQTPQALNGLVYLTRDELQTFGKDLKHIFDTIQQKVDETTGKTLMYHKGGVAVSLNSEEVALRDAVVDRLRENGIDVITDVSEGQRVLDMANGKERLSGKQKRALETAEQSQRTTMATVVSSADGAKVLNNLDNLAKKLLEKESNRSKTFMGDVARAIGAKEKGSSSQYATFETKNGTVVTIRLANHNAKVSNFDNAGKDNAISIVITRKPNKGMTNDGTAHIVEFYYPETALQRADGKPLAEIVRSIKQALYSGEFKDTTGIAERQEVNGDVVREHRVYHGSGADFEAFDHSHMGEGEGVQAYGWGTYVTEVEGIGRTYAEANSKRPSTHYEYGGDTHGLSEERINEILEVLLDAKPSDGHIVSEYEDALGWYRNRRDEYSQSLVKDASLLNPSDISIVVDKTRILYSVEIPEDNGKNYLDWNERLSDSQIEAIRAYLSENYRRNKLEDFDASIAESKGAPNADEVNAWARRGKNVYKVLSHLLGSDDAASKALSEMGFAGIKYPAENRSGGRKDGAKNYVIFNEGDAKIVDKVRFFKTANGEAYGFVVGGKIYIDPRIASSETSVHEYAHLWAEALRSANAKEWSNVVGLMRGTSVWNEVRERYPELKSDDEIADEVLATYSGRRGSECLREEMERIKGSERSVADKARALGALERVRRALDRFWHGVADFLGIHYKSADEVADRVMRDLLSGVDPRRFVKGESDGRVREQFVGEDGVSEGRGEQGRSLRGDEALTALNRIFDGEVKDELPPTIPTIEKFRQIFSKPIRTFLGELIKVKDNVYNKIQKEKRTRVSGAVMPTIKNADFAMRDTDGSTLYIKRFNNNTSDSTYNIAVVNKHGEVEDYISSVHIKRDANLRNKIKNGAELLLPNKRNGDGTVSRNNSTPDAKLGKISEKSDANGTLFRDEVDGVVSSSGVDGMRERAMELGRELGADVDVVSDVSEITDPNPEVQERKRRAKGWYDAKTGRVVINLAAHSDMADVEQTLLHEIVGHRGLRGLVGHENFNGFLDGIYEHASDVVREGIDDIARRKGCSKRVATEEYMSGLAEGGFADRKNAGLWQQIRQWFGDMLSRAKIKLNFSISDNELRYLLWRSHELSRMNGREGVVGRARDLAMQNRLGVGNGVDLFRTSKQLDAEYGSRWIDEQTNADGRHTTQVKNTVNSYKKFGEWVQQQANGKKVDVLDASSGLGVGTEWLREHGMNVDDVEPYPSENRTAPTYSSYEDIDKRYDYIISNAVLNVIPEDWRADVLHSMADKLKVGGKLVINVRGAESIRNQGTEGQTRITLDDASEILVLRPNGTIKAYQKGFTKAELKGWCEKELGDGYSVEVANSKNAGGSYDTAVVVTKNDESNTIGVASGATHPSRIVQEVRQPYEDTQDFAQFDSKIKNKSEYVEGLSQLSSKIEQKKFGAHEFLYGIAKAFGFKGNNFNHSMYQDLGGSVGIRISDHSANAENFSERGSTGENYGLVVKLSPHRFRSSENVDYLEYTYYPDKLTQERQKEIVDGLKDFLQTGDYSKLPSPDRVNKSGKFEQESSVDSYDGDLETLFRDADSPVDYERALIRDSYERRMKDVWFQSREALQDGMLSLKETMKDIWRSAGKKFSQITDIPDSANPYIGQNRLSSRNAAEVSDFKRRLFRSLLREVGRLTGFSADGRAKLTDYMMAKHGLERNKVMAERDAKHPNSLTCGP